MFGTPSASTGNTSLFGSTPGATNTGRSLFGSTTQTSQGGGLFGSRPTATSTPTPGGSLFGSTSANTGGSLFGSTTAQTPQAGSLFGSKPATGSTGLFGSTPANTAAGGSLFGSTAPTSQPGGLFGSKSATSTTNTGLFGSTGTTGGSLFGSTPQAGSLFGSNSATSIGATTTLTNEERSLQEIIANTNAIVTAVNEPKLYGDESDASITRLNQLLAANGIGTGYYDKENSIQFDSYNPFFQFRAVGYCALSRHKDSDGIVGLVLNQAADTLSTPQERQKLKDVLYAILGSDPTVHAHIDTIRPVTDTICEVEIFVTKKDIGRVGAKQLYQFFEQNDKKSALSSQLKCESIVPRMEMSPQDVKRYLSFPPKGFTEDEWKKAISNNPDPQTLLPYPIYGYKELDARRKRQLKENEVQHKHLNEVNEKLKNVTQEIEQINGLKKIFHEDAKRLRHRILRIIAVNHNNSHQSAVTIEEEKLLSRLETIAVCINAPNRVRQRCENLRNHLYNNKEAIEARKLEADHQNLTNEEKDALKRYLTRRQQDLDIISDCIKKDADDIQLMTDRV